MLILPPMITCGEGQQCTTETTMPQAAWRFRAITAMTALVDAIRRGTARPQGKAEDSVTVDGLAPVDEFHIGGRQASEEFLGQLIAAAYHLLVPAATASAATSRFAASRFAAA
jgi:hypothetical protein